MLLDVPLEVVGLPRVLQLAVEKTAGMLAKLVIGTGLRSAVANVASVLASSTVAFTVDWGNWMLLLLAEGWIPESGIAMSDCVTWENTKCSAV